MVTDIFIEVVLSSCDHLFRGTWPQITSQNLRNIHLIYIT